MFKKGDILKGAGYGTDAKKAFHPIVYIEGNTNDDFIGVMLTTSSKYSNNFKLTRDHFLNVDEHGRIFEISYRDSYLVHLKLTKKADWNPYKKAGCLSQQGIKFVEDKIKDLQPIEWEDYIKSKKRKQ